MEDDDIEISSGSSLFPTALAVLAIVLGGAGLYFGMTANQRLSPLADTMEAGTSSAARLEKQISALETQLAEVSALHSELKKTIDRTRIYTSQNEQAVKQVVSGVRDNRAEMVKLVERVNELVSSGVRPAPVAESSSGPERETLPPSASNTIETSPAPSTYTITSGDTFARIATKLGVSLQALLDANPGADPRRLAIGQVINVPGN
ncbi:MAG: LysM peptidoglycan-binding domain-containing protein [Opitutales bacterium]